MFTDSHKLADTGMWVGLSVETNLRSLRKHTHKQSY